MSSHRSHYFNAEDKPRIEIIPMIDIMMFLLVFFMLATLNMIQGSGLKLDLPQSSTSTKLESIKASLGVNRDGALFLDGKPISAQDLVTRLKAMQAGKQVDVVIAGDKGTEYQKIVKTMDLVRSTGISSVALATNAQ